ncbi:MAG: phosphoenolpyruvate carboxykinase (GTP) [Caldiserica bacterium]|jgi:phosphoenolpyruvate carboxykinase (GTP)|nr:phosphoenolpyruvate carboxykinase (GTP) [Caldisericota bacterium]MDH7563042.1 phosphoenolpyruvate carboxykinase (GTP) [Caldisericota bacterium]
MERPAEEILKRRLSPLALERVKSIPNPRLHEFLARYLELLNPEKVYVSIGTPEDLEYIRKKALEYGEEKPLATPGHTIHFDNYGDQGRDKKNTGILVPKGVDLGPSIETKDRDWALQDIQEIMRGIMTGKEAFVSFYCLGPANSIFSIPCVQITDSSYVAHSENILYRQGYSEFLRQGPDARFFKFVHSQGEVDERKTSKNLDKRRIYIDLEEDIVYSVNTQYGGNTIGLKKLAMRLAIYHASKEGWLTEHMLVMGVHGPGGRVTYLTGAFPSLCGKTSTAMLEGESILGDDIAYLRKKDGRVFAVNVEQGMFGIIQGINSKDDPIQWKALHSPGEIIFSNVLVTPEGKVHWQGKDGEVPPRGENHSGEWWIGKKDESGKEIPCSHPNARFTLSLSSLENVDPRLHDPQGVEIGGVVYGGRDSDTSCPVEESFGWEHGIITKGAILESETTAATLGKVGVREWNPMSNLDFLSIPVGRYIQINLDFGKELKNPPRIFAVNYFLKDANGKFLNEKNDKKVWYKWMELRINGEVGALETPTGLIPKYEDLKPLFQKILNKEYTKEEYLEQFKVRIPEHLAKIERVKAIFEEKVKDTPPVLFEVLEAQKRRLLEFREKFGDYVSPDQLTPK